MYIFYHLLVGISSTDSGSTDSGLSGRLCSAENFTPSKWKTLGRMNTNEPPHCPLVGEYTGIIPDAEGLCAKSYADCNNPEVMFYTVFNCNNATEIYEEREYRCFGQWSEPETGLVYTYTERRDILGQECFVGVDIDQDKSIVTEAGSNCERGHQPRKYGMTLQRQAKCPSSNMHSSLQNSGGLMPKINVNEQIKYIEDKILRDDSDGDTDGDIDYFVNRPISPRLSTVHSVVVDGRESAVNNNQELRVQEKVLDEIEREEEERYYENEMNFENSENTKRHNSNGQRFGHDHKKHRKHGGHNKHGGGGESGIDHGEYDQDIFSNEIPDSSGRGSADAVIKLKIHSSLLTTFFSSFMCLMFCAIVLR